MEACTDSASELIAGASIAEGIFERTTEFRELAGLKQIESLYLVLFIDLVGVHASNRVRR